MGTQVAMFGAYLLGMFKIFLGSKDKTKSMKLYTEEQMSIAIAQAKANPELAYLLMVTLKPIELPNEDEIYHNASNWVFDKNSMKWSNNDDTAGDNLGSFIEGAKWMRDKIQGGDQ
jgi:hypothetical protein